MLSFGLIFGQFWAHFWQFNRAITRRFGQNVQVFIATFLHLFRPFLVHFLENYLANIWQFYRTIMGRFGSFLAVQPRNYAPFWAKFSGLANFSQLYCTFIGRLLKILLVFHLSSFGSFRLFG